MTHVSLSQMLRDVVPTQPYQYRRAELVEPDWRRLPGYAHISEHEWRNAEWQISNSAKSVDALVAVFGRLIPPTLVASIAADQIGLATMRMRVTPQVLNTMNERDLWNDPIRRYVVPAAADRHPVWHTHPNAQRDSLHEADMSAFEGGVHRYPTKMLLELSPACPVFCGHCTRMDLVGPNVPAVQKRKFGLSLGDRMKHALNYLAGNPRVRDVVISGGDVSMVPIDVLASFVDKLIGLRTIRSIRLATKALVVLPQYFLADEVRRAFERMARRAEEARVDLVVHTHCNAASSLTPLVAEAAEQLRAAGIHTIRNQGVLMRGVNDSVKAVLDLCFGLLDEARITPYYFYTMDMIPHAEHWRTTLDTAQRIVDDITGYLPGFGTPRIVCDVPYVGKRQVHQARSYDRVRGISKWRKNYLTRFEDTEATLDLDYAYFDPVHALPPEGQAFWARQIAESAAPLAAST